MNKQAWVVAGCLAAGALGADAATLYRCRSHGGGHFWSAQHCQQHNALIDRIASVPDGMPFDQQVAVAQGQLDALEASMQAEKAEGTRQERCAALLHERDAIWRRSGSGTGAVPLEQLGSDRERWKQISRQLAASKCPTP
jgi:hypothetical protein